MTDQPLQPDRLKAALANPDAGALVSFEGWVRNHNHGRAVLKLEYEAYLPMALNEGKKIMDEAKRLFPIQEIHGAHRIGELEIGDVAVWIGVVSSHRSGAFEACAYAINQIKRRVPIWKLEHYAHGESEWVLCDHGEEA